MKYPFHSKAKNILFKHARHHRLLETDAEQTLWRHLRNRKQMGCKFRRQHPIGPYIVDFYCHECSLVIEADGFIHLTDDLPQYDAERTEYLDHLGLRVLRFSNQLILERIDLVLEAIRRHLVHHP